MPSIFHWKNWVIDFSIVIGFSIQSKTDKRLLENGQYFSSSIRADCFVSSPNGCTHLILQCWIPKGQIALKSISWITSRIYFWGWFVPSIHNLYFIVRRFNAILLRNSTKRNVDDDFYVPFHFTCVKIFINDYYFWTKNKTRNKNVTFSTLVRCVRR